MYRNSLVLFATLLVTCAVASGCENNLPKTYIDEEAVAFFDQASLALFAGKWDSTIVDTVFESTRNGGDFDFCVTGDHLQFTFEDENTPVAASGTVYLLLVDNKRYAYVIGEFRAKEGDLHPFEGFCHYKFRDRKVVYHATTKGSIIRSLADQSEASDVPLSALLLAINTSHHHLLSNPGAYVQLKRKE